MIRPVALALLVAVRAASAQSLTSNEGIALYEQHARTGTEAVMNMQTAARCGVLQPYQANAAANYFEADISHASFKYGHPVSREAIEAMFNKARRAGDRKATTAFCAAFRADPARTARTKEIVQDLMDQPPPDY